MKQVNMYYPRNDYVLLRLSQVDKSYGGVVLPEVGDEGKIWQVVSCGPDVHDLQVGDVVSPMGDIGVDIARLPREKDLFITKQANILMVVKVQKQLQ